MLCECVGVLVFKRESPLYTSFSSLLFFKVQVIVQSNTIEHVQYIAMKTSFLYLIGSAHAVYITDCEE